jgi:hypothetical protein
MSDPQTVEHTPASMLKYSRRGVFGGQVKWRNQAGLIKNVGFVQSFRHPQPNTPKFRNTEGGDELQFLKDA